jgi:hypothetical protein
MAISKSLAAPFPRRLGVFQSKMAVRSEPEAGVSKLIEQLPSFQARADLPDDRHTLVIPFIAEAFEVAVAQVVQRDQLPVQHVGGSRANRVDRELH